MDCKQFQKKWPDVLDRLLSPDEQKEWEAHRQSCASCRQNVEALESIGHELRGIPPANPLPPIFWQRQTGAILEKIERSARRRWERFWDFLLQPRTTWAAAALVLLVFVGARYFLKQPSLIISRPEIASKTMLDNETFGIDEEDWDFDLSEEEMDQYYAHLAQRYLPVWDDDSDKTDWVDDLDEQELNRAIQYFEKNSGRRTL